MQNRITHGTTIPIYGRRSPICMHLYALSFPWGFYAVIALISDSLQAPLPPWHTHEALKGAGRLDSINFYCRLGGSSLRIPLKLTAEVGIILAFSPLKLF